MAIRASGRWIVLLALLLVVPGAAAQTFLTPWTATFEIEPGGTDETTFTIKNPINRSLFGFVRIDGDLASSTTVTPTEFQMGPTSERTLTATVDADNLTAGHHTGRLTVSLVDRETGRTQTHTANLTAELTAPLLLLGQWQTPLPAPLDGVLGLLLLEVAIFAAAGAILAGLVNGLVGLATRRMPERQSGEIRGRIGAPVFTIVLAGGLRYSWRFFEPTGLTGFIGSVLSAVVIAAIAFLVYRGIDASLLYYGQQIAPRTETRWDDVAVPVLRKITIALMGGFVVLYALQGIGIDLGFLVAGGVVIGLVLSSSLGPTLANLFSGLFILMDRPFREGDDIRLDTGEVCRVERIGLRSTRLYFYRNHEMIIAPNQQLENSRVVNLAYPDRRYRMHLPVSVAYGSPLDTVQEILLEKADAHEEVLGGEDSEPRVFFDDFGDNGLMFRLSFYVMEVGERFRIASELRDAIDAAFREAGVTIPFPQRTLWYGSGEKLVEAGEALAGETPGPPSSDADDPESGADR